MTAEAEVRIVQNVPQATAVIALTTTWEEFPSLWGPLLGEVWKAVRAGPVAAGRNVMLYKDQRPSVEVGVEVFEPFPGHGRVVASSLPGGRSAMTVAPGGPTVEGIAAAHERVQKWSAANGHELRGDRWEIYSHHSEDETTMNTEIHWALAAE